MPQAVDIVLALAGQFDLDHQGALGRRLQGLRPHQEPAGGVRLAPRILDFHPLAAIGKYRTQTRRRRANEFGGDTDGLRRAIEVVGSFDRSRQGEAICHTRESTPGRVGGDDRALLIDDCSRLWQSLKSCLEIQLRHGNLAERSLKCLTSSPGGIRSWRPGTSTGSTVAHFRLAANGESHTSEARD